jgi:hypothetical protein
MSIIINLKESRKLIENSLKSINANESLTNCIRFQHINTLQKIIYLQSCRLSHYAGLGVLTESSKVTGTNIACNKSKAYLAKCCQVTSRTIQNHLQRLESRKLIKRINTHGKLLLIVNPSLLSIHPDFEHIRAVLVEIFKSTNYKTVSDLQIVKEKTFPTNYSSGNFKNLITTYVDMLKKASPSDNVNQETIQEAVQETQRTKLDKEKKDTTKNEDLFLTSDRKPSTGGRQKKGKLMLQENIRNHVLNLWIWCVENLYADRDFLAESQQEYAMNYFSSSFNYKSEKQIEAHAKHLKKRLLKWKKFVSKPSAMKRFTPLPCSFFDAQNPNGFVKTERWLLKQEQKEEYNKIWKLARQIERKAIQVLSGHYAIKQVNPVNQITETFYRELTSSEKIRELQKLEYRVSRLSEKFPQINSWYTKRLQAIIHLINTNKAA